MTSNEGKLIGACDEVGLLTDTLYVYIRGRG